jgi:hypothetical protein
MLVFIALLRGSSLALTAVDSTMRSFGVAIKASSCKAGQEVLVFEHNNTAGSTHGVVQQQWHAGTRGDPRMRLYVDGEADAHTSGSPLPPSVDYAVSYAHGLSPNQTAVFPWQSDTAGHTHDMGWYNRWAVPFERRVRVSRTCSVDTPFWYRIAGAE